MATDLERASARDDPLFNVNWEAILTFPGQGNIDLSDYIEDITLPDSKIDNKGVFRQGVMKYFAKHEDIGQLSIKCYEDADLTAYRFFRAWKNKVRDPDGNYGTPLEYKGTLKLYPKATNRSISSVFLITGVFPLSLPAYAFVSGQTDRINPEFSLSCDRITPLQSDQGSNSNSGSGNTTSTDNMMSGSNNEATPPDAFGRNPNAYW
jgi:hypothetical protein